MTTLNASQLVRLKRIEQELLELAERLRGTKGQTEGLTTRGTEGLTMREALAKYARSPEEFSLILEASQTGKRLLVRHGRVVDLID